MLAGCDGWVLGDAGADGPGLAGADGSVLLPPAGDEDGSGDAAAVGLGFALALGAGGGTAGVVCPDFAEVGRHEGEVAGWDPVPVTDPPPLVRDGATEEWPVVFGPPLGGAFDELLGKIAVEASIATYVPAATMNITTAIAAAGRSNPCARERCLPAAWAGANRSETSRSQAATW